MDQERQDRVTCAGEERFLLSCLARYSSCLKRLPRALYRSFLTSVRSFVTDICSSDEYRKGESAFLCLIDSHPLFLFS